MQPCGIKRWGGDKEKEWKETERERGGKRAEERAQDVKREGCVYAGRGRGGREEGTACT